MKAFTLMFFFLSTSIISFGQSFKKDWLTFAPSRNWEIKFSDAHSSFLGKEKQGGLILENKSDTLLKVSYSIYLKADVDSAFQKQVQDWSFAQSCLTFSKGNVNFVSFDLGNYYYLLTPCHRCPTLTNSVCEQLARQLWKFVLKK